MAQVTVKAAVDSLDAVNDFLSEEMEKAELSMKLQTSLSLVVEEVFVNIAHYAYAPGEGDATVEFAISDGELTLTFSDEGTAYNPLTHEDPDITAKAEDRAIGGLGLLLVKKIMDGAEYRREGGRNLFILNKKL